MGCFGIKRQAAHGVGSAGEVGVRPGGAGPVVATAALDGLQRPGDQFGAAGGHEVEIAGIAGGDHRDAHGHRLGEGETEAFGAVQAHQGVGLGVERIELDLRQQSFDPADARIPLVEAFEGSGLFGELFGAAGFHQQLHRWTRAVVGREGLLERAQDAFRVFAFGRAPEIEQGEEGEGALTLGFVLGGACLFS